MADRNRNSFHRATLENLQAGGLQASPCSACARSRRYYGASMGNRVREMARINPGEKGVINQVGFVWFSKKEYMVAAVHPVEFFGHNPR